MFKLYDEFINEAAYVSPQEKEKAARIAEDKLKASIRQIMEKIRKDPENADIHKATLDVALAKQTVLDLSKKLAELKKRKAKSKLNKKK